MRSECYYRRHNRFVQITVRKKLRVNDNISIQAQRSPGVKEDFAVLVLAYYLSLVTLFGRLEQVCSGACNERILPSTVP